MPSISAASPDSPSNELMTCSPQLSSEQQQPSQASAEVSTQSPQVEVT